MSSNSIVNGPAKRDGEQADSDLDGASAPSKILPETLDAAVFGVGLAPGSLRDQLAPGPTLLVFLRHFGCIFCREAVADLRDAVRADPDYPDVLFFFQGTPTEGRAFLRRDWPDARAVSDPELEFYDRFGVRRASYLEALGPSVIAAGRRAKKRGFENGPRTGDVWRMPGIFVVEEERVVWSHRPRHAADHPDFARIPSLLRAEQG